jgi:hypothetical protein
MKLNKIYLLFISLLFLTSMASKMQVDGVQASIQQERTQQIHKTDVSDYGFMDFLFEEDTTENEEDNLFIPFSFSHFSSFLFLRADAFKATSTSNPIKAIAFLKTPIFLTFRNIRL